MFQKQKIFKCYNIFSYPTGVYAGLAIHIKLHQEFVMFLTIMNPWLHRH